MLPACWHLAEVLLQVIPAVPPSCHPRDRPGKSEPALVMRLALSQVSKGYGTLGSTASKVPKRGLLATRACAYTVIRKCDVNELTAWLIIHPLVGSDKPLKYN